MGGGENVARKNYSRGSSQQRKKRSSGNSRNMFAGADDVYVTENSIAVRRISTEKGRNGRAVLKDKTTYVPKTDKNLDKARGIFGFLRFGRK